MLLAKRISAQNFKTACTPDLDTIRASGNSQILPTSHAFRVFASSSGRSRWYIFSYRKTWFGCCTYGRPERGFDRRVSQMASFVLYFFTGMKIDLLKVAPLHGEGSKEGKSRSCRIPMRIVSQRCRLIPLHCHHPRKSLRSFSPHLPNV
jgi:hypothetical protein